MSGALRQAARGTSQAADCPSCDGQARSAATAQNASDARAMAAPRSTTSLSLLTLENGAVRDSGLVPQPSETLRTPFGRFHGRGRDRHRIRSGGRAPGGAARDFETADGAGGAVTPG